MGRVVASGENVAYHQHINSANVAASSSIISNGENSGINSGGMAIMWLLAYYVWHIVARYLQWQCRVSNDGMPLTWYAWRRRVTNNISYQWRRRVSESRRSAVWRVCNIMAA